jgi:hypothetical protein
MSAASAGRSTTQTALVLIALSRLVTTAIVAPSPIGVFKKRDLANFTLGELFLTIQDAAANKPKSKGNQ